nr:hypothetical protein [Pseudomonas sp. BIGb0427]
MSDFNGTVGGNCTEGQQGGEGNDSGEAIDRIHREKPFLVVMQVQVVVLALASESNQRHGAAGNEGMRECHQLVTFA